MGRLIVFQSEGGLQGFVDYDDTSLSVTGAGIVNPTGRLVTITVNRAADGRQEATFTSRTSVSGNIPPGRRQNLRPVVEDGETLLYLPSSWNLRWSVEA